MQRLFLLLALASIATGSKACIPPAPQLPLNGESDADYAERSRTFAAAQLDEDRRRQQSAWYDRASRISLARITSLTRTDRILSDGRNQARRAEAVVVATFKGEGGIGGRIAMEDTVSTTCGIFGGGSATSGKPGDYIVTFEGVQDEGTGNVGMRLSDLREPRIITSFTSVVEQARRTAAASPDRRR